MPDDSGLRLCLLSVIIMKFWANIRFYLRPLFRELKHPGNYVLAGSASLALK
jgi:hypothetical protein